MVGPNFVSIVLFSILVIIFTPNSSYGGSVIGNYKTNNNDDESDYNNPQQTCKVWTTPGYKSILNRALDDSLITDTDSTTTNNNNNNSVYSDIDNDDSSSVSCGWEPYLMPMTVHFSGGYKETFYAYQPPDVATFYNYTARSKKPAVLQFTGRIAKFINMSPQPIYIYWNGDNVKNKGIQSVYINEIEPFGSTSTATYPNHIFIAKNVRDDEIDPTTIITEWTIGTDTSLYYYDPFQFDISKTKQAGWNDQQIHSYHIQLVNRAFAYQYKQYTGGIDWLGLYKHKNPPRYHMWRCDSFGQTYTVDTREIHYVELPPDKELHRGTSIYGPRPDELERMRPYKDTEPILNLTITAVSCAPRVFEIPNFMSDIEINHILNNIVTKPDKQKSRSLTEESLTNYEDSNNTTDAGRGRRTRQISRNTDMITDGIYRRAADVLQINESLLRWRRPTEIPEFPESMISIAERLQYVHYTEGQQYAPHYDFTMARMVKDQPSRFATMIIYLNDNYTGGETSFPKWLNADTGLSLKIKPQKGKAILFYNILPDGNYDERSQHASMKITKGEKHILNLWVWDPVLDHTVTEHH